MRCRQIIWLNLRSIRCWFAHFANRLLEFFHGFVCRCHQTLDGSPKREFRFNLDLQGRRRLLSIFLGSIISFFSCLKGLDHWDFCPDSITFQTSLYSCGLFLAQYVTNPQFCCLMQFPYYWDLPMTL